MEIGVWLGTSLNINIDGGICAGEGGRGGLGFTGNFAGTHVEICFWFGFFSPVGERERNRHLSLVGVAKSLKSETELVILYVEAI